MLVEIGYFILTGISIRILPFFLTGILEEIRSEDILSADKYTFLFSKDDGILIGKAADLEFLVVFIISLSLHIELWLAKLDLPTHIFALFVTLLKIDLFRNLSHTYLLIIVTSLFISSKNEFLIKYMLCTLD